ncbi:MAG: NAD(+) synthase [bacterium]
MQAGAGTRGCVTMGDVDALCGWLREHLLSGLHRAVVGISGGVDSSVVAALCVRAVGRDHTVLVRMPCGADPDVRWTNTLVKHLGCTADALPVNIRSAYEAMEKELRFATGDPLLNALTCGNMQARLRMVALYAVANHRGGLVVGTTNAAEAYIGYATKYGDHGVDLEPLLAFDKGEVRQLGRLLGLPEALVDRPPTAGLWIGQTDQEELGGILGTSNVYGAIDAYLRGEAIEVEVARKIDELHTVSAHKRCVPPHFRREPA